MLPNFLGIGAPRCGTTWIHRLLQSHPEAFVPRKKEIHFFDKNYDKGLSWYEQFFVNASNAKAVGEITPSYISTTEGARRIRKDLGDIRLFAILRNPAERAFSHYLNILAAHRQQGKNTDISFKEMIDRSPRIIEEGFYARMLQPYFAEFTKDCLLILFYDDIAHEPRKIWMDLCGHLGIDATVDTPWLHQKANASRDRHGRFKSIQKIQRAFEKMGFFFFSKSLGRINAREIPQIPANIKNELIHLYSKDIQKIQKLTNRNLINWFK